MAELEKAGVVQAADTLEALAALIGVDANNLVAEVDDFNTAQLNGEVDPWRGEIVTNGFIDRSPYNAARIVPVVAKNFGGIDVDIDGRVLTDKGTVIPGLFAAGELTGMAGGTMVGDRGFTGSLSAVLLSGRIAGQEAVQEVLGEME